MADGLIYAVAGTLLGSEFVVLDGTCGVVMREVQVADSIINLVQIVLVAVVAGHALERLDLTGDVGALIDGALLDAGIELGAVG